MPREGVFQPSYRGIGQMLRSRTVLGPGLSALAERVAAEAKATAPRDSGEFADSIQTRLVADGDSRVERVAAQVYSTDPDGLHIETGAPRKTDGGAASPRYRRAANTLSRALDVIGE